MSISNNSISSAREQWQLHTISETVQFLISSEKSAEIAMLLQMLEDCSRCAQWQQESCGRQCNTKQSAVKWGDK